MGILTCRQASRIISPTATIHRHRCRHTLRVSVHGNSLRSILLLCSLTLLMGHTGFQLLLLLTAHNSQALHHPMLALTTRAIFRLSNLTFPLTRVLYNPTQIIVSIHHKEANLKVLGVSNAIEMMFHLLPLPLNLGWRNCNLLTIRQDLSHPVARSVSPHQIPKKGIH